MFGLAQFAKNAAALAAKAAKRRRLLDSEAVQSAARINAMIRENYDGTWTIGDGTRVRVQAMSDSHLFYALVKAGRGEYPDSYSRRTGIRALEVEALRRLIKVTGWNGGPSTMQNTRFDAAQEKALAWGKY